MNMSEKRIGIWILPFFLRMCPWPLKPLPIMTIKSGRGTSPWLKFFFYSSRLFYERWRGYKTFFLQSRHAKSSWLGPTTKLHWGSNPGCLRMQAGALSICPLGHDNWSLLDWIKSSQQSIKVNHMEKIFLSIVCSPSFETPTGLRGPRGVRTGCRPWTGSCWSGSGARTPSDRLVRILSPWLWGHISKEKNWPFELSLGKESRTLLQSTSERIRASCPTHPVGFQLCLWFWT